MKISNPWLAAAIATLFVGTGSGANLNGHVKECGDCHGPDGVSQWDESPTIAGISEAVHADALLIYQDGERPCPTVKYLAGDTTRPETTMCTVARELDESLVDEVAAHFAAKPFVPANQKFDADLAAAGETVHAANCDKCHSAGGSDPADDASILAGQWMGYLQDQLRAFRNGEREKPKSAMRKITALSEEDIEALLNYYASQQ